MKLTIGFSPCPNDTFIFDAMVHGKIDTEGLAFEVVLADVEELNRKAAKAELDITKLSYHAFAYLTDKYMLLRSGSALGNNCGPLLVSNKNFRIEELKNQSIAIPGRYTTANFLLNFAFPNLHNKTEVLFSDIEKKVLTEEFDLGVIIHENRFTYAERGLVKIMDLGEFWEQQTALPIPLGGIVCKRDFNLELLKKVNRVLRKSIVFAFENPGESDDYVCQHAQEMDPSVMKKHIELYVNQYSIDLGEKGEKAIQKMFSSLKNIEPSVPYLLDQKY
jgi:1,4-dihydroxy-6-naphthoate synthase